MSKAKQNVINDVETKLSELTSKSAKIRYLNSIGWTRKEIKIKLNISYQHVRNVLVTVLKKDLHKLDVQ